MGDIDDLARLFPLVDRSVVKQVAGRLDEPTPEGVAAVLDNLANAGKLPQHDYREMMESNRRQFQGDDEGKVELDVDDPLDAPPDADPTSEENARRGQQALQWAKQHGIDKRAVEVGRSGSVTEMVELLNTVDRWANEALLKPELGGLGDTRFKRALDSLSDGLRGVFDEMAARGAVGELESAKQEVSQVRNPEMRRGLLREIDGYVQLATGSGADFERAKGWALDEGLSPWEVLKRVDNARHDFDITYQQQEQLEEAAREWLEEYRELQQQVEA
jgi:hypothetical protein